jgi:hypothetical protein
MAAKGGSTSTRTGGISSAPAAGPSDVPVEELRLKVTFPKAVKTVDLSSEVGTIHIDPKTNVSPSREGGGEAREILEKCRIL